MTKQVKCISPHGGCHNGMLHNGTPVFCRPDGTLPDIPPEELRLPPNPGGWIENGWIPGRFAAVGQVYDVADDFIADGFHFEDVAPAAPPAPPAPAPPVEGTP